MRAWLVVAAAVVVSLAWVASAAAAERTVERGIVQSIGPGAVVLRALDGTDVSVVLGPDTRIRLNGRLATVADIRPGFVAEAVIIGAGPASVLRAFGRADGAPIRGVLARIASSGILLRRSSGEPVRIAIAARTTVWRGDRRIRLRALRTGMRVEVILAPSGIARAILVLRERAVT